VRIANEVADQVLKCCITGQALEEVANGGVSQAALLLFILSSGRLAALGGFGQNNEMAQTRAPRKTGPAPKLDRGTQLNRVRRICGSIPGTIEKTSHGEPTFFTPKRVFVMFANNHHDDGHVAVWIPAGPGVQEALIEEAPDAYFRPPYVGVKGWVGIELSKVDDEQLGALIREAFRLTI